MTGLNHRRVGILNLLVNMTLAWPLAMLPARPAWAMVQAYRTSVSATAMATTQVLPSLRVSDATIEESRLISTRSPARTGSGGIRPSEMETELVWKIPGALDSQVDVQLQMDSRDSADRIRIVGALRRSHDPDGNLLEIYAEL